MSPRDYKRLGFAIRVALETFSFAGFEEASCHFLRSCNERVTSGKYVELKVHSSVPIRSRYIKLYTQSYINKYKHCINAAHNHMSVNDP